MLDRHAAGVRARGPRPRRDDAGARAGRRGAGRRSRSPGARPTRRRRSRAAAAARRPRTRARRRGRRTPTSCSSPRPTPRSPTSRPRTGAGLARRRARRPPAPARARSTSSHKLRVARPDVEVGALHPLQSLPSPEIGVAAAAGLVVRGRRSRTPSSGWRMTLGMRPFRVDGRRPGRVPRRRDASRRTTSSRCSARWSGSPTPPACPLEALLPLVRATLDNVETLGAGAALTGPGRARRRRHRAPPPRRAPDDEHAAYRALARAGAAARRAATIPRCADALAGDA